MEAGHTGVQEETREGGGTLVRICEESFFFNYFYANLVCFSFQLLANLTRARVTSTRPDSLASFLIIFVSSLPAR